MKLSKMEAREVARRVSEALELWPSHATRGTVRRMWEAATDTVLAERPPALDQPPDPEE